MLTAFYFIKVSFLSNFIGIGEFKYFINVFSSYYFFKSFVSRINQTFS
ncbi:hypothetical protein ECDEC9B_5445 [Escherichia coli DEC9B]|nr:hypothetical protein ECDEC9B_5445 [Escherichia coli DEC9B]